jgi:hypothetical protein
LYLFFFSGFTSSACSVRKNLFQKLAQPLHFFRNEKSVPFHFWKFSGVFLRILSFTFQSCFAKVYQGLNAMETTKKMKTRIGGKRLGVFVSSRFPSRFAPHSLFIAEVSEA